MLVLTSVFDLLIYCLRQMSEKQVREVDAIEGAQGKL